MRLRRYLRNAGTLVLSALIVVWSLAPIYNMVLISLEPEGDVFTDHIWPRVPSFESFWGVLTQGHCIWSTSGISSPTASTSARW